MTVTSAWIGGKVASNEKLEEVIKDISGIEILNLLATGISVNSNAFLKFPTDPQQKMVRITQN